MNIVHIEVKRKIGTESNCIRLAYTCLLYISSQYFTIHFNIIESKINEKMLKNVKLCKLKVEKKTSKLYKRIVALRVLLVRASQSPERGTFFFSFKVK